MKDQFNGDNEKLIASISALLKLDAAGALVPHGVGGHARLLLEAAAIRLGELDARFQNLKENAHWQDERDMGPGGHWWCSVSVDKGRPSFEEAIDMRAAQEVARKIIADATRSA